MAQSSNVPENMTVVDGVRVRKEDERGFRTRHKAVLAPSSSAGPVAPPKAKTSRAKHVEASGGEPIN